MEEGDAILDCRCLWRVAAIFLILARQRPQSIHGSELLPATPTHVENLKLAVQN